MRMQKPDLDPFRRVQLDAIQIGIVRDPLNQLNEIALSEEEVVFVEAELPDAAGKPVLDLVKGTGIFPYPHAAPFVQNVRSTIAAFERAASARGQDRVLRQLAAGFRFPAPVFAIQI